MANGFGMAIRREQRDVYMTSDNAEFRTEDDAKLHEARFQLTNLIKGEWFYGIEPESVVDLLLTNSDRVIAVLKELKP